MRLILPDVGPFRVAAACATPIVIGVGTARRSSTARRRAHHRSFDVPEPGESPVNESPRASRGNSPFDYASTSVT
jgi:hypothetical protein